MTIAVNKYLHTVASVGFLFTLNYDAQNHELEIYDVGVCTEVLWLQTGPSGQLLGKFIEHMGSIKF